jgi:hypothetical protein
MNGRSLYSEAVRVFAPFGAKNATHLAQIPVRGLYV